MNEKACDFCSCKITSDRFIDLCQEHKKDENNGLLINKCDCDSHYCSNCKIKCEKCHTEECKKCVRKCDDCNEITCRDRSYCDGIAVCKCNSKVCSECYYRCDHHTHNYGIKHNGGCFSD